MADSSFEVEDIVARRSYGEDVLFKIADISEELVTLKGIFYRIQADAPRSDLVIQSDERVREHSSRMVNTANEKVRLLRLERTRSAKNNYRNMYRKRGEKATASKFVRPCKILHVDGDKTYVALCLEQYKKLDLEVVGRHIAEKEQPTMIYDLLRKHNPDILVLTGHDGLIREKRDYTNINSYKTSKYFIEAVKQARKYEKDVDSLVIFAGACQSMYADIINSGANFASSPTRVLIHALDPVFVSQKIALTSADFMLSPIDVISTTITGVRGIGGIQTRGKYREGYPAETY
jgi:spore coat assembly protein